MDAQPDGGERLDSGGLTRVVRVGATVRRPVRPFTATVQAYLSHLRSAGFLDAPEPRGVDTDGREVLCAEAWLAAEAPRSTAALR